MEIKIKPITQNKFKNSISNEDLEVINGYLAEVNERSYGAYKNQKGAIIEAIDTINRPISMINMVDVKGYLKNHLDTKIGLNFKTKKTYRSYLNSFFIYYQGILLEKGIVYQNPVPPKNLVKFTEDSNAYKKVSEQEGEVFTKEYLLDLLERTKKISLRDFVFFGIEIACGMRISECVSIKIENINLNECFIETGFEKEARKSKKGLLFFFPNNFKPYLELYMTTRKKQSIWLFPGRTSHILKGGMYSYCKEKYNLTSFHSFRRTLITNYIKNGCDLLISEMLMNHKPSSVEGAHYVKLNPKERRPFYDKFFPYKEFFCF